MAHNNNYSTAGEVTALPDEDKKQVFMVVDALIRDFKAKKAYTH